MRKTNAKRFTSLSEIEIEIGVNVQRDSIAIPPPNHSQSIRNCWFVISFTHVHTTNAKRLPLSEGMFKEIEIRIGVYVTNCKNRVTLFHPLTLVGRSEIEIEIGVNPPPNHSQSTCAYNKVFKEIEIRIGVYVQRDSIAIPSYNYSQSITNYLFVVCHMFTHVHTTNAKRLKPLSEGGA